MIHFIHNVKQFIHSIQSFRKSAFPKYYSYNLKQLEEFEKNLSTNRFNTYLKAANKNKNKAIYLYTLNTAISGEFYGPLQTLEVTLRNSLHEKLSQCYSTEWYDNPNAKLDKRCKELVENNRRDLIEKNNKKKKKLKKNNPITPPDMIANFSFGFWVSLLSKGGGLTDDPKGPKAEYKVTLWMPALCEAFPHGKSINRKYIHQSLDALRLLRNRIAHHEPIFNQKISGKSLKELYDDILKITESISPQMKNWIVENNRVKEMIALIPDKQI